MFANKKHTNHNKNSTTEFDADIPHYKKKSKGDQIQKSTHKHAYEDCLLIENNRPYKSQYCHICGKIGKTKFMLTEKTEDGYYHRALSDEEIYDRYPDIPRFNVDSIFDKYVGITK